MLPGPEARLARVCEAAVLAALPEAVPHPPVLAPGRTSLDGVAPAYSLIRRLPGDTLDRRWPALSAAHRHAAVARLGEAQRALHAWTPRAGLVGPLPTRTASSTATFTWPTCCGPSQAG
ncbi:hypothetical protein J2S66_003105 [Saccharothrix longispora]|uniref:Aminoglycoside phosphotransferase domain-containing protein n=1 Tax=Saccharothrix longispora TaxID=33920 RepID=A0ABU1PVR5_9PSEU|nr:phosphotransferase [Saccharothrix longispora]MDR6594721.1 hypothetical protein [Saccharothrix longispora]